MKELATKLYAPAALIMILLVWPAGIASGQSQTDTLYVQNETTLDQHKNPAVVPLSKVLEEIERTHHIRFLYQSDLIEGKTVSEAMLTSANLARKLGKLLVNNGLTYEKQGNSTYIIKRLAGFQAMRRPAAAAQITGTVTDASSGETLPGVNILVKGTSTGTSTDSEGNFELTVESLQDTLVVSFIGYQTREVPIQGRTEMDIALQSQAITGEEMVVVGYGAQQKSSLTSAVSEIDEQTISEKTVFDSRRALQGLSPGVTVIDRGGAPGQGSVNIRIRGNTTIGNNEPLVLVDGIERSFSDINPNDIANITVLKDASATAIYGSRGSNGVILVTTKDPEQGELQVSYNGYYGISELAHKPNHMDLEPYMRYENAVFANLPGGEPRYTEEEIQEYVNADNRLKNPLPNTMWDAVFSAAPLQSHDIQFSGGSDEINGLLSLNYSNEDGIMPNFGSNRYGGRLRANLNPLEDFVQINTTLTYKHKETYEPYDLFNTYWRLWHDTQWAVPKYPDGTYGLSPNGYNPLMYAEASGDQNGINDYVIANIDAEIKVLENLTYSVRLGGNFEFNQETNFAREYSVRDYFNKEIVLKNFSPNELTENRFGNRQLTWDNLLNYKLDFKKFGFSFLGGYSEIRENYEFISAYRREFYNNSKRVINAGSENSQTNSGYDTEETLRSVFARFRTSYNNTYIVEANARYDGSSKFYGSNNQFGFFPSFSMAWNISNESFWEPIEHIVSDFKLRGSWGKTGNNSVDLYQFYTSLNPYSYVLGGNLVKGFIKNSLSNKSLTWEKNTQTDIGFDAEFLNGIVNVTFDYYWKRTDGILLTLPIPSTVGLDAPPQNAGIVDNKGWEFAATYNKIITNEFDFSITANLSDVHNEVVDLAGTGPYVNGTTVIQEGNEMNALYGYKAVGLFQSEEEIANHPTYANKNNTFLGDIKYADLNNDGIINGQDRTVIGSTVPRYTFGIGTKLNYKNFDLNLFFQGVGQADAMPVGASREGAEWGGFTLENHTDYWTPDNRDARFPRPQGQETKNATVNSSWWVVNASYLKLKNAQIGYSLPPGLTRKAGLRRLRIFVRGTDLITLSNAKEWGLDPEFPSGRLNFYPQSRQYSIGINLDF